MFESVLKNEISDARTKITDLLYNVSLAASSGINLSQLIDKCLTFFFIHKRSMSTKNPVEAITVTVKFAHYRAKEGTITLQVEPVETTKGFALKDCQITITKEGTEAEFVNKEGKVSLVLGAFGTH